MNFRLRRYKIHQENYILLNFLRFVGKGFVFFRIFGKKIFTKVNPIEVNASLYDFSYSFNF